MTLKRTGLKPRKTPLKRKAVLIGTPGTRARANGVGVPKRRAVSPATPWQRTKVRDFPCIACGGEFEHGAQSHPAHLIARSVTTFGQDDPLAVVPLGPACHRAYDTGTLDLLPSLEPTWRAELAFAVARVGLVATYRRVTNTREVGADSIRTFVPSVRDSPYPVDD
jgi:hypothetical protein